MPGIAPPLETYNDVGLLAQHIRNLPFSFVSPIGAYNCCNHSHSSLFSKGKSEPLMARKGIFLLKYRGFRLQSCLKTDTQIYYI